jgi:diketogulonate reductase-like aldo/keto reductase
MGDDFRFPARVGLGTYGLGESAQQHDRDVRAVRYALDIGYRLLDTAEIYGNGGAERVIGEALRAFGAGRRSELFLLSKVDGRNATHRGTVQACEASLRRLGCDYLDLYLLHGPEPRRFAQTQQGLDELLQRGLVRRIGVSNFSVRDLEEWGRPVSCNQVRYSIDHPEIERQLLPYQRQHHIQTMAYSPLGRGNLTRHPHLLRLAQQRGVTAAQIALAWCLHDPSVVVIPKSADPRRIEENLQAEALSLSREEREQIGRICGPSFRWLPRGARGVLRRLRQLTQA